MDEQEIPRRNRIDLNTPAELAIRNAITEVEKMGADPLLTDIVVALDKARESLANFIDVQNMMSDPNTLSVQFQNFDPEPPIEENPNGEIICN